MNSDNDLSAVSARCGSTSRGDVASPNGDPPAKEGIATSSRDAVTRKIRNPLLDPQATPPLVPLPVSSAPSEPPPRIVAGLVPPIDISENIHPFPPLSATDQEDKSSGGPIRARHKGLVIVVAIVVAGTAVDIILWRTSSARHTNIAHQTTAIVTSTGVANAVDLPGSVSAASTVPIVEPLPDRTQSEVRGKTAGVPLAPDVLAVRGAKKKFDVTNNQQRYVVEASAPGLVVSSTSVGSLGNTDVKIGVQQELSSLRPASGARSSQAAMNPKKDVRVKSTPKGGDEFGMDLRTSSARRPTTTIDEKDPYSP
jgi:hypothetical protein